MWYISNAFSCQMISKRGKEITTNCIKIDKNQVKDLIKVKKVQSCIGHTDICNVINSELESNFEVNRVFVDLYKEDSLIVCQFVGGRLPEGCKTLPEDVKLEYYLVW